MDSKADLSIAGAAGKKVTLYTAVSGVKTSGKKVDINGTKYASDNDGVITFTAPNGDSFKVCKADTLQIGKILIE